MSDATILASHIYILFVIHSQGKFKASGRFLSKIFLDTFSTHYRYTLPKNPLPNWDTPIPVGGLALAAAAVSCGHAFYQF